MAKHFKEMPVETTTVIDRVKNNEAVPQPSMEATVPRVSMDAAVPQVSMDATVPQVSIDATVPQPRMDATVPQERVHTEDAGGRRPYGENNTPYGEDYMPYGQVASYRSTISDAAPTGEFYTGYVPARGGSLAVGRGFILFFAWFFRLCAVAMVFLVLFNSLAISVLRPTLNRVTDLLYSYLPWDPVARLAVDTPFGGVFNGDLALLALLLFVIDWVLCKVRARLR